MVKKLIILVGFFSLFLANCGKQQPALPEVKLAVWGNWVVSNQFDPVDYKSRMVLSPLFYRYFWDENPDFSILDKFTEHADTMILSLQENLYWHDGEKISKSDIIDFIREKTAIPFDIIASDSISLKIISSGAKKLNWYFAEPFMIQSRKVGNGLYKLNINTGEEVQLSLFDSLNTDYPRLISIRFLGEKPSYEEISSSDYDIVLQLPISYLQKFSRLKDFKIEQKNRNNVAALFMNQRKIKNAMVFCELLNRQLDRKIIVDAILWNYGSITSKFHETKDIPEPEAPVRSIGSPKGENLKVLLNRNPIRINVLQEMAMQIPPSLFTLEPDIVDWQRFLSRVRNGNFDVVFLEWSFDTYLEIFELWAGDDPLSAKAITGIDNKELKEYLCEYNDTWDSQTKDKFFSILNEKIKKTFPVTFLYRQNFVYLTRKKTEFNIAPDNWFQSIREWQLEAENE